MGKIFQLEFLTDFERNSTEDFDFNTFGYWNKKDTCYVKFCVIDRPHYDFLENIRKSIDGGKSLLGSFKIRTNINGGLGIWGGYSSTLSVYYPQE